MLNDNTRFFRIYEKFNTILWLIQVQYTHNECHRMKKIHFMICSFCSLYFGFDEIQVISIKVDSFSSHLPYLTCE